MRDPWTYNDFAVLAAIAVLALFVAHIANANPIARAQYDAAMVQKIGELK